MEEDNHISGDAMNNTTLIRLLKLSKHLNQDQVKILLTSYKNLALASKKPLEKHLMSEYDVSSNTIEAIKKAYENVNNFGTVLERHLRKPDSAGEVKLNNDNYEQFKQDLEECVKTQQSLLEQGRDTPYIGEMMARKNWLHNGEINQVLREQGMVEAIKEYGGETRKKKS